jgi:hypothetical protein
VEVIRKKERQDENSVYLLPKLVEKLVWVPIISLCKIFIPMAISRRAPGHKSTSSKPFAFVSTNFDKPFSVHLFTLTASVPSWNFSIKES